MTAREANALYPSPPPLVEICLFCRSTTDSPSTPALFTVDLDTVTFFITMPCAAHINSRVTTVTELSLYGRYMYSTTEAHVASCRRLAIRGAAAGRNRSWPVDERTNCRPNSDDGISVRPNIVERRGVSCQGILLTSTDTPFSKQYNRSTLKHGSDLIVLKQIPERIESNYTGKNMEKASH